MTKIVLYIPSLAGGGAERVIQHLCDAFAVKGHQVTLLLDRLEGAYKDFRPLHGDISSLKARKSIFALPRLLWFLSRHKPDVVLSGLPVNNLSACAARMLCPHPFRLVISDHNTLSLQLHGAGWLQRRLMPALLRLLYPLANALVCVSAGIDSDFQTALRLSRPVRYVIDNPILPEGWQDLYKAPLPLPHTAHLPRPIVLAAGRLTPQKDYPCLLRAYALFHARHGGSLLILGEGNERAALTRLAQELGIESQVHMPGFVNPVFPFYRLCDIFVLSSAWEGFGNVLVEAMAAGKPVVATNCPSGPAYILDNGRYGQLVPPGNPERLRAGIEAALSADPTLLENARQRAMEFEVRHIADRYLQVLMDVPPNARGHVHADTPKTDGQ